MSEHDERASELYKRMALSIEALGRAVLDNISLLQDASRALDHLGREMAKAMTALEDDPPTKR